MSQICIENFELDAALRLETKCVEVAWWRNDPVDECKAYERVGYIFYLMGNLKEAKRFHTKSIECILEDPESHMRKGCTTYMARRFNFIKHEMKNYNVTWKCVGRWGLTEDFFRECNSILIQWRKLSPEEPMLPKG